MALGNGTETGCKVRRGCTTFDKRGWGYRITKQNSPALKREAARKFDRVLNAKDLNLPLGGCKSDGGERLRGVLSDRGKLSYKTINDWSKRKS